MSRDCAWIIYLCFSDCSFSPCSHLLARRRQVSRSGARALDLAWTRRSQPQERQQLLLHDPVLQRPHPPADGREEPAREGDGGGQRQVQDRSVWYSGSMWVLCSQSHTLQTEIHVSSPKINSGSLTHTEGERVTQWKFTRIHDTPCFEVEVQAEDKNACTPWLAGSV